jgi:hypothetical protein
VIIIDSAMFEFLAGDDERAEHVREAAEAAHCDERSIR